MRNIENLKYCKFVHSGLSKLDAIICFAKIILFCWLHFYQWIVVVETKSAGKYPAINRDVYVFEGIISAKELLNQISEAGKIEKLYLIDCLNGGAISA